jgi:methylsterol monooxygenase/4-alpha-methyl-delta7-sterol-4alpha-methyl oxidase
MSGLNIYILGLKCRTGIDTFPGHKEIILHVLFMMFTEDLCFYWSHRLLHHRKVYPIIHKTHHEYFNSVSICALYAHPFEFLFSNTMSTAMGFLILGPNAHIASFYIWLTIRIFETIDGHCGYEFSWSPFRLLPLSGSSEYHNFHHSHNLGTYGSFFTFWDTVCGTNKDYF